ncbi:MAG: malto-oligosyltrehalose trehalohydrolase [Bryobacteraceae bacterium]
MAWQPTLGAVHSAGLTAFRVWAPDARSLELETGGARHAMAREPDGCWSIRLPVGPGTLYRYAPNGDGPFPDPASRFQPEGVHGPSQVVSREFPWTDDAWANLPRERLVIYELHTGTFTPEGTFAAAAVRLPYLRDLGVTAVELMPVSAFPGQRNWGYDGVQPFAPAACYGAPEDMKAFVDRAHRLGLAVFLDVVYNHFGPDGAYQGAYSKHYYSDRHGSPWGEGINFDGPHADGVRRYVLENVRHWVGDFHLDGLRLDATHALIDLSPVHILADIARTARETGRPVHIIAEDDRNERRLLDPAPAGGYALDGVWADDFHHQIRVRLNGDRDGYFADFDGAAPSIARALADGWFYSGQRSESRGAPRGTDPAGIAKDRFVVCIQNHDQIGNRAFGDRLHHTVSEGAWRAASALLLLAPETPLLFMGQEWGASSPFQFFTDHYEELGKLVTAGRRREFSRFEAFAGPATRERIPDPQSAVTFERSKLDWSEIGREPHAGLLAYCRALLAIRAGLAEPLRPSALDANTILLEGAVTVVVRLEGAGDAVLPGEWSVKLASDPRIALQAGHVAFPGPGAAVFERSLREPVGA